MLAQLSVLARVISPSKTTSRKRGSERWASTPALVGRVLGTRGDVFDGFPLPSYSVPRTVCAYLGSRILDFTQYEYCGASSHLIKGNSHYITTILRGGSTARDTPSSNVVPCKESRLVVFTSFQAVAVPRPAFHLESHVACKRQPCGWPFWRVLG
jgi:hypothetical protein